MHQHPTHRLDRSANVRSGRIAPSRSFTHRDPLVSGIAIVLCDRSCSLRKRPDRALEIIAACDHRFGGNGKGRVRRILDHRDFQIGSDTRIQAGNLGLDVRRQQADLRRGAVAGCQLCLTPHLDPALTLLGLSLHAAEPPVWFFCLKLVQINNPMLRYETPLACIEATGRMSAKLGPFFFETRAAAPTGDRVHATNRSRHHGLNTRDTASAPTDIDTFKLQDHHDCNR